MNLKECIQLTLTMILLPIFFIALAPQFTVEFPQGSAKTIIEMFWAGLMGYGFYNFLGLFGGRE